MRFTPTYSAYARDSLNSLLFILTAPTFLPLCRLGNTTPFLLVDMSTTHPYDKQQLLIIQLLL
jgi:hypothetical protein